MTRRRRRASKKLAAGAVTKHARAAADAALHGHCTRAFEALSEAQTAYGRSKTGTSALGEARQTFFRECVVPQ